MKDSRKESIVVHLTNRESGSLPKHPVHVQNRAIRRQDHDGLANAISYRPKVRRLLAERLLEALKIIYVGIDPTPADKGLLAHRGPAPRRSGTSDTLRRSGEGASPSCQLPRTASHPATRFGAVGYRPDGQPISTPIPSTVPKEAQCNREIVC